MVQLPHWMNFAMLGMAAGALAFICGWLLPEVIQDHPIGPATRWQTASYWMKISYVIGGAAVFALAIWRLTNLLLNNA